MKFSDIAASLLGRRGKHRESPNAPMRELQGGVTLGGRIRSAKDRTRVMHTDRHAASGPRLFDDLHPAQDLPASVVGQTLAWLDQPGAAPGVIGAVYGRRRQPEVPQVTEPEPGYPKSYLPGANSRTRSAMAFERGQVMDTNLGTAEGNRISVNLSDGSVYVNNGKNAVALTRVWTPNLEPGAFRFPTAAEATSIETAIAHRLQMSVDERPPMRWLVSQATVRRETGAGTSPATPINEIVDSASGRRGQIVIDTNERRAYAQFENETVRHDLGAVNLTEARAAELGKTMLETGSADTSPFAIEVQDLRDRYSIPGDGPVEWTQIESVRHFQDAGAIVQEIDLAQGAQGLT